MLRLSLTGQPYFWIHFFLTMKIFLTIGLLLCSNIFMTLAWYGHLKLVQYPWFSKISLIGVILFSWGIALFEYFFQVPANRIGFQGNGGPFSLVQLKVMQEVITLTVFMIFSYVAFHETIRLNQLIGFLFLILAVYFIFKPWYTIDYKITKARSTDRAFWFLLYSSTGFISGIILGDFSMLFVFLSSFSFFSFFPLPKDRQKPILRFTLLVL